MNRSVLLIFSLTCALFMSLTNTYGQTAAGPRVEISIADELVLATGTTRTAQRDSTGALVTRPGDVIRYTLTTVNRGTQPAHEAEIIDPVPKGTEYVLGSATGDGMTITFSIDEGKFFQPLPITYDFQKSDGTIEKRPALPEMYTHIKWLVNRPILPKSSVTATFRVRVSLPDTTKGSQQ